MEATDTAPASWLNPVFIDAITSYGIPSISDVAYVHESTTDGLLDHFRFRLGGRHCEVRARGLGSLNDDKREAWLWIALRSLAPKLLPAIRQIVRGGEADVVVIPRAEYERLIGEHAAFERVLSAQRTIA